MIVFFSLFIFSCSDDEETNQESINEPASMEESEHQIKNEVDKLLEEFLENNPDAEVKRRVSFPSGETSYYIIETNQGNGVYAKMAINSNGLVSTVSASSKHKEDYVDRHGVLTQASFSATQHIANDELVHATMTIREARHMSSIRSRVAEFENGRVIDSYSRDTIHLLSAHLIKSDALQLAKELTSELYFLSINDIDTHGSESYIPYADPE